MKETLLRRAFLKTGACGAAAAATGTLLNFAAGPLPALPQSAQRGVTLTKEWQDTLTPEQIIPLAKIGNQRFLSGQLVERDYHRYVKATKKGQYPAAIV